VLRVSDRRQEPRFDRSLVVEPLVASELRVRMRTEIGEVRVEIADDGRGGADPTAGNGTGLRGLADRVEALGGQLAVESPPGQGTTVRAVLPLE